MSVDYLVGIDLGTMNTAVAGSNGVRQTTRSEVGVPKDQLVHRLLKKDYFFGSEIDAHRNSLLVQRPFELGRLKYAQFSSEDGPDVVAASLEAAYCLLAHAIAFLGLPQTARVGCVLGVPAQASLAHRQEILAIARRCTPKVVLVPEPFAVAFNLECLTKSALIVDIGAGTIDFCNFYGAFPTAADQLTIGFGGDHVDRSFRARVLAAYPQAQLSLSTARRIKEKCGFVGPADQPVHVRLPVREGLPQTFDVTEPLHQACTEMAEHTVKGIVQMLGQIDSESVTGVLENVVLSGGGSQLRGLDNYIESALEGHGYVNVSRMPDIAYAGAQGALQLGRELSPSMWDALQNELDDRPSKDLSRAA